MAGAGIPEEKMVQLVVNPATKAPIDAKTLRRHFRNELDGGHTKADTLVSQGLFKNATTPTKAFPGGIPLAQIFWLKVRTRWKPPSPVDVGAPPPADPGAADARETARRMAFLLAAGAAATEKPAAAPAAKPKKKVSEPA